MAHKSPDAWDQLTRINTDIGALVQGSSSFQVEAARAALTGRAGVEVSPDREEEEYFDEELDSGSVFFEGRLGNKAPEDPAAAFRTVLGQQLGSETLGIEKDAANLRIKHVERGLLGRHLRGEQLIGDLPVYGSEVTLHLDDDDQPYALTGRPFPESLGAELKGAKQGIEEPLTVVSQALGLKLDPARAASAQVALPQGKEFLRCWQVKVSTDEPFADWNALVSLEGELLMVHNVACALHGEAFVYLGNPERDVAAVRARLDSCGGSPPVSLQGLYACTRAPAGAPARSPTGSFFFDEADPRFDEPNLYYALDAARKDFERLSSTPFGPSSLFDKPHFAPMVGLVHYADAGANAFFRPHDGMLYFGQVADPGGGAPRSLARSRDIAIHEFTHAVSDSICRLGRTIPHTQSRAMSEGYSDYFACSMLDNPVMGDYFIGSPAGFRTCDNDLQFPRGFAGEEHDVGQVWAGFLWSLRQHPEVGRSVADALALDSLYFLGPYRSILQGLKAVLAADRRLFPSDAGDSPGRHEGVIRQLFDARLP